MLSEQGSDTGSLSIKQQWIDGPSLVLWTKSGNQSDQWVRGHVLLTENKTSSYRIIIEGIVDDGPYGSIAIDDISIQTGSNCILEPTPPPSCGFQCGGPGRECVEHFQKCDFVLDCENGADEEICGYNCTFEGGSDTCGWTDASHGAFKWQRHNGTTPDANTGPSIDHTTMTNLGHYVYIDSSLGSEGSTAVFRTPSLRQASSTCQLVFWYHMYGSGIGTLQVSHVIGSRETYLWRLSRDQGNMWHSAIVPLARIVNDFYVTFEASRTFSALGDIALDDIVFEGCALPGHFLFIDTRHPHQEGQYARLASPLMTGSYNCQLRFYYYISGQNVGALRVYQITSVGSYYERAEMNVFSHQPFQVIIEGSVGSRPGHGIAIDDLSFSSDCQLYNGELPAGTTLAPSTVIPCAENEFRCRDGKCLHTSLYCDGVVHCSDGLDEATCAMSQQDSHYDPIMPTVPAVGSCTFEERVCGWRDMSTGTCEWRLQQGLTAAGTAPQEDHTTGTPTGWYMLVDSSTGSFESKALLESPVLGEAASTCTISFWYHMSGFKDSSLALSIINGNKKITVWSRTAEGKDQWTQGRARIGRQHYGYKDHSVKQLENQAVVSFLSPKGKKVSMPMLLYWASGPSLNDDDKSGYALPDKTFVSLQATRTPEK
nr:PREDICTED: MAM and LDL-receptor class A domain-containing protein 1-like [Latimeria chalumnae]|eukprot:XP_014344168.1 PREDICTED: MAM and LDL-receptor class A domain-containing protein 1-like [Latimeria chalumnae]